MQPINTTATHRASEGVTEKQRPILVISIIKLQTSLRRPHPKPFANSVEMYSEHRTFPQILPVLPGNPEEWEDTGSQRMEDFCLALTATLVVVTC